MVTWPITLVLWPCEQYAINETAKKKTTHFEKVESRD